MTRQGNGQHGEYEVRASERTRADLKQHQRQAAKTGIGEHFLSALRVIGERLRTDPLIFGEPQYRLPALKLSVRQAVVAPVVVDYAVHEERPIVFIRGFKVLA